MRDLSAKEKVRVLLAQALFGKPDNLLLDEPTNDLDLDDDRVAGELPGRITRTRCWSSRTTATSSIRCARISVDIDLQRHQPFLGQLQLLVRIEPARRCASSRTRTRRPRRRKRNCRNSSSGSAPTSPSRSRRPRRRKMLEQLNIEEIKPSMRKYPGIIFQPEREAGNEDPRRSTSLEQDGRTANGFSATSASRSRRATRSPSWRAIRVPCRRCSTFSSATTRPIAGIVEWGVDDQSRPTFPLNNAPWFESQLSIVDWLAQFSSGHLRSCI